MSPKASPRFYVASPEKIREGLVTDIYFVRAKQVLEQTRSSSKKAMAEIHCYGLPNDWKWAVLTGVEELAAIFEGKRVNVYAVDEGMLFRPMVPVVAIEGLYSEFGVLESAVLGVLRHATSVSTKAARIKMLAGEKSVIFFGIRSVHPAIAPMVDRAAFIGGCDAVAGVVGAEMIGEKPVGTMPHALILVVGNQVDAWKAFDEAMPPEVPRIALCDTFMDERFEALLAAETLGKRLLGVRLDTPSSRRGDMRKIVQETRWALQLGGHNDVKIFVSGGIDEDEVAELRDVVDGFGVGTSIAFPPPIDLALDIVEVEGKPVSKRGKLPGRKQVYRCPLFHDTVTLFSSVLTSCPKCGRPVEPLLKPLILDGKLARELPSAAEARQRVLKQLELLQSLGEFDPEPLLR